MKTALGLLKAPDVHLSANTSGYETAADDPLPAGIPPLGPIRIRNLEDILKRLQHHLQHHQVPDQSTSSNPLAMGISSLAAASSSGMSQAAAASSQSSLQQQPGPSSSASGAAGSSSTAVPLANNNNGGTSSTSHLF